MIDITSESFSTTQASRLTGVKAATLHYWDKQRIVRPSVRPAEGKGSRRYYSYSDLLAIKAVKSMRDSDLSMQLIRKAIGYLQTHMPDMEQPIAFCALLTDGQTVYLLEDERELLDVSRNQGQRAMTQVSISQLEHHLRHDVYSLPRTWRQAMRIDGQVYQVQIESDAEGGYTAEVPQLPGCITQAETLEELEEMVTDAVASWREVREELAGEGIRIETGERRRSG
ncbi:MAG: MerR family transcriptional regulator [Phycisphaerae bacterium]